ncbi:MAG: Na+/H+ antiporter subunit C [Devosia sp.]
MEMTLSIVTGFVLAGAIYLILSRALVRVLLGVLLLGNGTNLLIFTAGRLSHAVPPIIAPGKALPESGYANPLPQALILTAIVIGFAMFAYLAVLAFRAYESMDADDTDHMRLAEPEGVPNPPLEY